MEENYDSAGVDLTLIRWLLSLSIAERMDVLEGSVEFAGQVRLHNGLSPIPEHPPPPIFPIHHLGVS